MPFSSYTCKVHIHSAVGGGGGGKEEERADSTLVSKQVSSRGKAASHAPTDRLPRDNAVRFSTPRLYHIICFLNCVEPHHPAHVLAHAVNYWCHQHFSLFPTFVLLYITLVLYKQIIPCSRRYLRGEGGERGRGEGTENFGNFRLDFNGLLFC